MSNKEETTNKGVEIKPTWKGPYLTKLTVNGKDYFLGALVKYIEEVPVKFLMQFKGEELKAVNKWLNENLPKKVDFEEKEIKKILTSDDPLKEIGKLLEDWGIVGEENNKKAIFLLLLSGKIKDPELKQIILLKGEPGGGKSTLMRIASLFKVKDVGRFTEHALDYTDLSNYEVLRLKEIGKMDEEKQGVSTIKFLSADDQGYTVEYTIRGKDGKFTTETKKIPPITVITSTTRVDLDPQFERRAWIFNPDESEDQTRRILEAKAKMKEEEALKKLGLITETSKEKADKILKKIVEILEPYDVVIPFPKTLTQLLRTEKLRVRGDYDKIYALIYCYHFLLQKKLGFEANGKKLVVADPYYTLKAIELISEPLTSMVLELDKRARQLIQKLEEIGIVQKGETITKEDREELARRLGKSERTIRRFLNSWEKAGYLSSEGGRGKPKIYTLLYSLEEIKQKEAGVLANIKSTEDLIRKMHEEARKFLDMWLEKSNLTGTYLSMKVGLSNYMLKQESWTSIEWPTEKWPNEECPTLQPQKVVGQTQPYGKYELDVMKVLHTLQEMGGEAGILALAKKLRVQEGELRLFLQDHLKYFVLKGDFVYTKAKWNSLKPNGDGKDVIGERSL